VPAPPQPSSHPVPSEWRLAARALAAVPLHPLRALAALPGTLAGLDSVAPLRSVPGVLPFARAARWAQTLILTGDDGGVLERTTQPAPKTLFNDPLSPHRTASYTSLSLATVKAVKNRWGVTVNDVVMAVCAGGIRKRLLAMDALPDRPMVAMVPVSVRTPEQLGTFGNRISTMLVTIPTDQVEPKTALELMHETMRSAKEEHQALPATLLQDAAQLVPPALASRASRTVFRVLSLSGREPGVNVVISNVPGAPFPLYCSGAEVIGTHPISILFDGVGLNITVLSYRDKLDVGIAASREQGVDLWALAAELEESLAELAALG
jgi:diacylglycerol O-acyltransferase